MVKLRENTTAKLESNPGKVHFRRWKAMSIGSRISLIVLVLIVMIAVLANILAPHDPYAIFTARQAPDAQFLFGTDDKGRDVLSRMMYGARYSLIIGLGAKVSRTIRKLASENGVSIIATPLDTYTCAKVISQAVPVRHVMRRKGLITFEPEENVEDVKRTVSKKRIRYYPLLDEQGRELGLHLIWIPHDLMDPRTVSRRTMRDTVSSYMDTVMHATPVDETLLDFADDVCM